MREADVTKTKAPRRRKRSDSGTVSDEILRTRPELKTFAPETEADPDATPPELQRGGESARTEGEG